jgi:TonB dependent receptor
LPGYQHNKLRLWSVYHADLGRMGAASISGLIRSDSPPVYSLVATGQPLTAIQSARLSAAGYQDAPSSQAVYFGARGSEEFKGYNVLDVGLGYNVPMFKTLRPWLRLDIYNVFNIQKLIAWNTTVYQDPTSSTDALGLATGYIKDASFGKATSNDHFPAPFQGETGGRTLRLAGGLRF